MADLHPVLQGLLGTLFTYGMTAAGAGVVFFTKNVNKKILDAFYGFAAGVMISASCFGLLLPAIEIAETQKWSKNIAWLPAGLGFLLGVGFLKLVAFLFFDSHNHHHQSSSDQLELRDVEISEANTDEEGFIPLDSPSISTEDDDMIKIEMDSSTKEKESNNQNKRNCGGMLSHLLWGNHDRSSPSWKRTFMLIAAITLHNFPEGLAVGVAFGAAGNSVNKSSALHNAVGLAIGIGIQNFPEGLGVSMPLRREGMSRLRAFFHGQLSGVVEPIGGVLGAAAVLVITPLLPFALSFAAGAMMFVVVEELIPESQGSGNQSLATTGTILGFTIMMVLDVALG